VPYNTNILIGEDELLGFRLMGQTTTYNQKGRELNNPWPAIWCHLTWEFTSWYYFPYFWGCWT